MTSATVSESTKQFDLGIVDSKPIVVLKIGTSSLIKPKYQTLNLASIARLCEAVRELRDEKFLVIVVTSGSVGAGAQRTKMQPPSTLAEKQALAAVGQVHLMSYYTNFLSAMGLHCAQVLLTADNLANRPQYLNARNTFRELLRMGVVPIVNENDTVATAQLRFGDNDTLSAQVAALVGAQWLFLLTDVDALYTANPNKDPEARPIPEVASLSDLDVDTSTAGTRWGTGGMVTKLTAARIATAGGCATAISHSAKLDRLLPIINGARDAGTVICSALNPVYGKRRWILSVPVKGQLELDDGAVVAVRDMRKSLFSVGVRQVMGDFAADDAVQLTDTQGNVVAQGLVNYSSEDLSKVLGRSSSQFESVLGYIGPEEVLHRDHIALLTNKYAQAASNVAKQISATAAAAVLPSRL